MLNRRVFNDEIRITQQTSPRLVLFFLLMLSGFLGTAQNVVLIDSLRKQFITAAPEKKFELLSAIGFEYRYSFPDSTIEYCNKAYALGRSLHLPKNLSRPLSFIGLASANKGDFKTSLKYHYESIDVAIEQNDSVQLAFGYNNLARMFFDEGDIARAYTNLIRARELFEVLQNKSGLAYIFRSLSNIYKSQHDYAQALEMSNRAYALRKEIGEPRGIVSSLVELGMVYEEMKNGDKALEKFKMADSLVGKVNDKVTQAEVKMGIAEILLHHEKYDESFQSATAVLKVVTILTNQKLFLRANLVRAQYFYYKKAYDKAIPVLKEIVIQSENNLSSKREACYLLSEIYRVLNRTDLAVEYTNAYKILDEKLQNTNLTMQINQLKFKLDMEKVEKENDLLKLNQAKDQELISTQKIQNILLLITVVLVSAILIGLWVVSIRRRKIHHQLELQNLQIIHQGEEIETKNKDLSLRNKELSDLNHEKDTMMNIVAHDLKSPINHILGLTKLIQMDDNLTSQQKEYVGLIQSATHSGLDLIVDLLDVNALQEMGGKLDYTAFDWNQLVQERIKSFEATARFKEIKIVLSNDNESETVISEKGYINRILDNLLSNAIKFSHKGSEVHVTTTFENKRVKIIVKDFGPGFSIEDKQFLFQRFKKLSARPTGGESSNGLGLTIVKTLVDRLAGHIQLISERSKGSEFIITIPVRIAEKWAL